MPNSAKPTSQRVFLFIICMWLHMRVRVCVCGYVGVFSFRDRPTVRGLKIFAYARYKWQERALRNSLDSHWASEKHAKAR